MKLPNTEHYVLVIVCTGPVKASGMEDLDQVYNGSLTT